jgi:hypothetical protein
MTAHPLNLKLKHIRWRNAAYHYVIEHGSCTVERICESITHKTQPKNIRSATQLLMRDKRFEYYYTDCVKQSSGEYYKTLSFEVVV